MLSQLVAIWRLVEPESNPSLFTFLLALARYTLAQNWFTHTCPVCLCQESTPTLAKSTQETRSRRKGLTTTKTENTRNQSTNSAMLHQVAILRLHKKTVLHLTVILKGDCARLTRRLRGSTNRTHPFIPRIVARNLVFHTHGRSSARKVKGSTFPRLYCNCTRLIHSQWKARNISVGPRLPLVLPTSKHAQHFDETDLRRRLWQIMPGLTRSKSLPKVNLLRRNPYRSYTTQQKIKRYLKLQQIASSPSQR